MTYIVDTHVLVWLLDKNKRLSRRHAEILSDSNHIFIFSTIVLAEIKHLISIKRIAVSFDAVIEHLGACDNCIVYPVNEDVVDRMPEGLGIHDALIAATGLVYRDAFGADVFILTEDEAIRKSGVLPVADTP